MTYPNPFDDLPPDPDPSEEVGILADILVSVGALLILVGLAGLAAYVEFLR